MITVNLYYHGKNGSARRFVEEMETSGTANAIRSEEGNLRYEYFYPADDPCHSMQANAPVEHSVSETVLLIDSWRDQDAIDAHHASPMMDMIASLREKYDLHMTAERFINEDTGSDEKYLRKRAEDDGCSIENMSIVNTNGHEYVDLGLSVKWATMNIGASGISGHGCYYSWGETENKNDYSWGAYKHGASADALTKYNFADNAITLETADDAAAVNWGGGWRIPSSAEWEELCDKRNCTWEWTTIENTSGYRITSKKAGYAGKCIFLPAAGYFRGQAIEGAEKSAYYWSSNRNRPFEDRALCLYFIPNFIGIGNNGFRNGGFTVRPVIR